MAEDGDSWIYDSVVGFLNSPIWMVPIESFVDQNCLVFDGSSQDTSEYSEIHSRYKLLVEELLESFTKDLHITSQQFIGGCQKGRAATSSYTQGMFEYVFASVNYDLFKSIMVRHNAALSLQALQMIRGGTVEEAEDLEAEVMKFSEQEFKAHRDEFDMNAVKEMADLEAALIKSRIDCETLLKDIEKDKNDLVTTLDSQTTDAPPNLYPVIPQFIDEPIVRTPSFPPRPPNTSTASLGPEQPNQPTITPEQTKVQTSDEAAQQWIDDAKVVDVPPIIAVSGPSEQTLEERRQYWLKRKQEIVELKKTAALKTLTVQEESCGRPKSAHVAKRVVVEGGDSKDEVARPEVKPAMSQALADALRREVVHR